MTLLKLNNDDIFISYSRYDAKTYTDGLANELIKKGFSCFTDALGTERGTEVPESLLRKLKNCRMLVVVGSPAAGTSKAVEKEIETFSSTKGTTTIVLIDFNNDIARSSWYSLVYGLRRENENFKALETGNPSPAIVSRIEKAFSYRKSKDRLKRYTQATATLLIFLIIASMVAGYLASIQLKQAKIQQAISTSFQLANESQSLLQDPKLIVNSVDKAIQSMEIDLAGSRHSLIPDMALRSSLAYLPDLKYSKEYPGKKIFFMSEGSIIEERTTDTIRAFYKDGESSHFFKTIANPYTNFAFSKDCRYVAVASVHKVSITCIANNTTKYHRDYSEEREIRLIAISPNGRYVVIVYQGEDAGDFDTIEMWDTEINSIFKFPLTEVNVNNISFSSNGDILAMGCNSYDNSGNYNGVALLWDLSLVNMNIAYLTEDFLGTPYRHQQEDAIEFVAPGEDYKTFASVQHSGVTVWKFERDNRYYPISYVPVESDVYSLVFKPGMKELGIIEELTQNTLISGSKISIWNYNGFKELDKWILPFALDGIAYDNKNGIMGYVPYDAKGDEFNKMMYWQTKKNLSTISYPTSRQLQEKIKAARLPALGNVLFELDKENNLTYSNKSKSKNAPVIFYPRTDSAEVQSFKVSPQGKLICISVRLYNRNTNKTTYGLSIRAIQTGKQVALVSNSVPIDFYNWVKDEKHIMFNYNNYINVVDIEKNKLLLNIYNSAPVSVISLSSSGKYIGYGTENGNIRIFETASLSEVTRIKTDGKISAITFNDDDCYFATYAINKTFLDLNDDNFILSSWILSPSYLIREAKNRIQKINRKHQAKQN